MSRIISYKFKTYWKIYVYYGNLYCILDLESTNFKANHIYFVLLTLYITGIGIGIVFELQIYEFQLT